MRGTKSAGRKAAKKKDWPTIRIWNPSPDENAPWRGHLAEAHIRERAGSNGTTYRYLRWRDGGKIRELYLGSVRQK